MKTEFPSYLLAAFPFLLAFFITLFRMRKLITPFHFCLLCLFFECVLAAYPLLKIDTYGRTHYEPPTDGILIVLILSSISFVVFSFILRPPTRVNLTDYHVATRLGRKWLITLLLGITIGAAAISFVKLRTFPLFAIASFDPSTGNAYEFAYSGFVTFIGWGAARTLALWSLIEIGVTRSDFRTFTRKHYYLLFSTAVCLLCNVLDGQRNALVLMGLNGMFLASLRNWVRPWHLAAVALVGISYFVVVGNFRSGGNVKMSDYLRQTTGIQPVDSTIGWGVTYLEPNLHNFNNLINLDPPLSLGFQFLTDLLPDALFTNFGIAIPDSAPELLSDAKMFSQPGLTFRTAYADFLPDFGALGSAICVIGLYLIGVLSFNKAAAHPTSLLVFMMVAPIIVFAPFMNIARNVTSVMPLMLFFVLRFPRVHRISSRKRKGARPAWASGRHAAPSSGAVTVPASNPLAEA